MSKEELLDHINCGREIEFMYHGRMYSITYGTLGGKHVISFCEFYKETTEVERASDILCIKRNGVTVLQMLQSLTADDIWIF